MSQGGVLTDGGSAAPDVETLTGNSGGPVAPTGGNINTLGTGSITIAGNPGTSTLTTQLTGLTNHNVLVGAGTATITNVAPSATSGVPLISQGAAADPIFGTVTVPGGGTGLTTLTANSLYVGNGTAAPTALGVANNGFLPIGQTGNIPTLAPLTAGTNITILNGPGSITISAAGGGDVTGPAGATTTAIAVYNGATGKIIQNSVPTIDATGNILTSASVGGATLSIDVVNSSNTANSVARMSTTVAGSSAGDATFQWGVSGGQTFTAGIDNSVAAPQADPWKLSGSVSLGTTDIIVAQPAGEVTMPLQPAFLAYLGANVNDVTGTGTAFQLGTTTALTEVFDQSSDFNTNGTFTAPITGVYDLTGTIYLTGTTVSTAARVNIVTSNRTYGALISGSAAGGDRGATSNALADMDAADTAVFQAVAFGEAGDTDDLQGGASLNASCYVCGQLSC